MMFLPIADRELRVRARQPATYRLRLTAAGTAILIVSFLLIVHLGFFAPGQMGAAMFAALSWLAFFSCLLEGPRATADCLSSEKRGGTLGLLFLTDLKGYDVVVGKWLAHSLNSFYALLAVLPALGVPLLLGGVTGGEFWRTVLGLGHTLFLSLNAGLFVSAVSRDERKAWGATTAILFFLAVVPPLLRWVPWTPTAWLGWASPTTAFLALDDADYSRNPGRFWGALAGLQLSSWTLLLAASFALPRAWQDRPLRSRRERLTATVAAAPPVAQAAATRSERERQRLLNVHPVVWLAGRHERQEFFLWLIVALTGSAGMLTWFLFGAGGFSVVALLVGAVAVHLLIAIWVAFRASYLLADARESGVLELLLSTPLSAGEILTGYRAALQRQFFGPVVALIAVEGGLGLITAIVIGVQESNPLPGGISLLVVGLVIALFLLDLHAVGRFGMWLGLKEPRPVKAFTKTVAYVVLLPLLPVVCSGFLWPVLAIVKNLGFIHYSDDNLRRHFRRLITEPREPAKTVVEKALARMKPTPPPLPPVLER